MIRTLFHSIKTSVFAGLIISLVLTLFLAKLYIQYETKKQIYITYEQQLKELTTSIADSMKKPLETFSPSDASNALEIVKQNKKIVKIEVYDNVLEDTFIEIYLPSREEGEIYTNHQKIYSSKNEELGWIEITINNVTIQNQLTKLNQVVNIVLFISFILLLLVMLLILSYKVFSPLKILLNQAYDFKNNKLEKEYTWTSYDELSLVGKSFESGRNSILTLFKTISLKNEELEKLYITDKLTGVYNRHKLDMILMEQQNICERYKQIFGVIIIDINDFKHVNDNFGHQRGDMVLIEIAKVLKNNIRETDTLGRWGEEFLIIMPQTKENDLYELSKKLKSSIESHDFKILKQITASFGCSLYEIDIDTLIKNADDALYQVKRNGKNGVRIF